MILMENDNKKLLDDFKLNIAISNFVKMRMQEGEKIKKKILPLKLEKIGGNIIWRKNGLLQYVED